MNNLNDLKRQYNDLLMVYCRAEAYLDDESIKLEEKEKHIGRASEIIKGLNKILGEIKNYTADEVLNGFQYITGR